MAIPGIGDVTAELLYQDGFKSAEELAGADIERVTQVEGVSTDKATGIVKSAQAHVEQKRLEAEARAAEDAAAAEAAALEAAAAFGASTAPTDDAGAEGSAGDDKA
jgi:N utilization substance protein A